MSGKTCARCGKVVYPIEELKCLDKIWHKQCFKCQVCQMTLNMRNYKGFNKEPFCEAHIPKAKATTVAETPEYRRIAENTKLQSNVKYHADFEKAKGKFTQVADDPETLRIKENSKNISNVAYHGELQKKADMERQRTIQEGVGSEDGSHPQQQQQQQLQQARSSASSGGAVPHLSSTTDDASTINHTRAPSNVIYTSHRGAISEAGDRRVGSIHDLDPVNDYYGSLASEQLAQQRYYAPPHEPTNKYSAPFAATDAIGNRRDTQHTGGYPANGRNTSGGVARSHVHSQGYADPRYSDPPPPPQPPQQHRGSGRVLRAIYEYNAQDADEVSFQEGDYIVNCTPIDEGWLSGVVQRTGEKGMLPANYVTSAI